VVKCIKLAEKDKELPQARRAETARAFADQAMALLGQAVKAGFRDTARLAKDVGLDPLRRREDFKKLLAQLQHRKEKAKP
jgi:hypothetical protein